MLRFFLLSVVGGAALVPIGGCNRPRVGKADPTYDRLFWIGAAYMAATDELNQPPASFEELQPYLKRHGEPAEIRRSANDNEEFIILWNVDYRAYESERKPFPIMVYEKDGKNGRRYVLQMRIISELTDEQLKQAPFPPGHMAPI